MPRHSHRAGDFGPTASEPQIRLLRAKLRGNQYQLGAVELATAVVSRRYLKLIRMRLTSRSPTKPHLARLIARSAGTQEEIEIAATVVRTLPAGRGVGDFADLLGVALAVTAARLFRREGTEINPTSPQIASSSLLDPTVSRAIRCISASRSSRSELHFGVGSWPMFLAPVVTSRQRTGRIPFEEEKMRRQFGDAFDTYARKVRRADAHPRNLQ